MNIIKFRNDKKQSISGKKSLKQEKLANMSFQLFPEVEEDNKIEKGCFGESVCNPHSHRQAREYKISTACDRRNYLLNQSLVGRPVYRSPFLTP